jgi:hypothetical protein
MRISIRLSVLFNILRKEIVEECPDDCDRRQLSIREDEAFGLDASNVVIENALLVVSPLGNAHLKREP